MSNWSFLGFDPYVFICVTLFVSVPYFGYTVVLWSYLQSNLMGRAMVSLGDTRQLLVVGTQSSGTMSTATDLKELGFEVEHENSDALWSFSRDGTVSWFHGIRFLRGVADEATLNMLCIVPAPNMGFHPAMYGRAHSCSHRTKWDACWQTECKSLIKSEWGCALRKATTGDSKDSKGNQCETPFLKSFLQVRHPLRTIESLVAKFCIDGTNDINRTHPWMLVYGNALFPRNRKLFEMDIDGNSLSNTTCLKATGWYYENYMSSMFDAHKKGAIDYVYKIEEANVCEIAEQAGFLDRKTAVHGNEAAMSKCHTEKLLGRKGKKKITKEKNKRNKGRVKLDLARLKKEDSKLESKIRKIMKQMEYEE